MISGVEVRKRTHGSANKHFCFGEQALVILRVRPQLYVKFEDHALTDELGISRTREVLELAGGKRGNEQNCGFSTCLLGQKELRAV